MLPLWDQSGLESDGNEEVLHISQISSINGTSPSDCLVSYPRHLFGGGGSYLSAEMQSVYSTVPADWTAVGWLFKFYDISTFVDYLIPNPFLYKQSVLFQTIQFSISSFNVKNSSILNNSVLHKYAI